MCTKGQRFYKQFSCSKVNFKKVPTPAIIGNRNNYQKKIINISPVKGLIF